MRIGHRSRKIHLCGKMEDDVRVDARHDAAQLRRLNVGPHEGKPAYAHSVAAKRVLEVGRNARAEVIDPDHLVAVGQKTVDQSRSDKPGGACDEGSHDGTPARSA